MSAILDQAQGEGRDQLASYELELFDELDEQLSAEGRRLGIAYKQVQQLLHENGRRLATGGFGLLVQRLTDVVNGGWKCIDVDEVNNLFRQVNGALFDLGC